jgi:hypothetical protein
MDNFDKICIETIHEFKKVYGEKKFKEIENKILTEKSIRNIMAKLQDTRTRISASLVVNAVSSVKFFVFSNKKNYALGCLLFTVIWNQICNIGNAIHSDEEMVEILEECFAKSKNFLW